MTVKAVVFDLFKTLGEFNRIVTDEEASAFLRSKGYAVYPQAWRHAFNFTVFVEYPRHGYGSHEAIIGRALQLLEVDVYDGSIMSWPSCSGPTPSPYTTIPLRPLRGRNAWA